MTSVEEVRYIQAYSRVIGVRENDAIEYAHRKGIASLVDNASQLLTTPTQMREVVVVKANVNCVLNCHDTVSKSSTMPLYIELAHV